MHAGQRGMSIVDFLQVVPSGAVASIINAVGDASATISKLARAGGAKQAGSSNEFGDAQLELDLAAEEAIIRKLSKVNVVAVVASEENPNEQVLNENGTHSVAFDPLDGSSIVGCNWAVGSIVRDDEKKVKTV